MLRAFYKANAIGARMAGAKKCAFETESAF